MTAAPVMLGEPHRLANLSSYRSFDSTHEDVFNKLTELAQKLFNSPISGISFVDDQYCWLKAEQGAGIDKVPREQSICAWTILGKGLFIVNDTFKDPYFTDNPLLREGNIRFYAGVPLVTSRGHSIGAFFIVDKKSRTLSYRERLLMKVMGNISMHILEMQKQSQLSEIDRITADVIDALNDSPNDTPPRSFYRGISVLRYLMKSNEHEAMELPRLFENMRGWTYV